MYVQEIASVSVYCVKGAPSCIKTRRNFLLYIYERTKYETIHVLYMLRTALGALCSEVFRDKEIEKMWIDVVRMGVLLLAPSLPARATTRTHELSILNHKCMALICRIKIEIILLFELDVNLTNSGEISVDVY